jgi:hypothetical protein
MKKGLIELVFILDRSGSMSGLEADTIGGYNSMLAKQKIESGEAIVTTVLFDDQIELLHDRINLKVIRPITDQEYYVRGSTALMDAIGRTISKITSAQKHMGEEDRAESVLFVITTDGLENASSEYTDEKIRRMIKRQKSQCGWEFIFLGANIDAIDTASRYGIDADHAVNYNADSTGTQVNYEAISEAVSCIRANTPICSNWKRRIDDDYSSRKPEDH